ALLEDLALYDNESWNDPKDFAKSVKAIFLPQDVLSTSDHRLIKLKNQVQRLMEAHLALKQPTQVNKITTSLLGKAFIEISNMTHDPPKGVVRFTNRTDEIAYKMPHKIEQYNSLLDLEKEHTKSVPFRNDKDRRRGVEYVMSKILGFYKECLELGTEYVTGMDDEGEVT
nr:MAK10-like protein [Tanacetum cinerariifolium]